MSRRRRPATSFTTAPALGGIAARSAQLDQGIDLANRHGPTTQMPVQPLPVVRPVSGPDGAVDGDIAVFDGDTGRIIRDSGVTMASVTSALAAIQVALRDADQVGYLRPSKYEHDASELASYVHRLATDADMVVGERGRVNGEIR